MLRPPLDHLQEIVAAAALLLLPGLHTGRVHQRDAAQNGRRDGGSLELVEIVRPVVAQRVERRVGLRRQRIPRRDLLLVAVHHRHEPVGRRLGPDVLVGEVAPEEVADEGGLADRVLPDQ